MSRMLAWGLIAALGAGPVRAREFVVSGPAPNAIAGALDAAQAGDLVRLSPGVYRERVAMKSNVTLQGVPGAVLDPSEPWTAEWRAAPEFGRGVFQASVEREPATLLSGGAVLAEIDARRTGEGAGAWSWKTLMRSGPPLGGYRFIRAIWIYRPEERRVYLRFGDDADPMGMNLSVLWSRQPTIEFNGVAGGVVRDLELAHGFNAVELTGGARHCSVLDCRIGPWDKTGVYVTGGALDCLIEDNEITRGSYEDWNPDNTKLKYEIWQVHKRAGYYDRVGVNLVRAGIGNRVHRNHIYLTFDGIDLGDASAESLDKPLHGKDEGRGTEIWENVIERTRDSGMELGAGCIDVRVHDNVLLHTHGGLRFKVPRIGPVYIYRNRLIDGSPFNIWFSMDDSPAEGHIYENTIVGGGPAVMYSSFETPHHLGTPHWHIDHNVVIDTQGFFANRVPGTPANFEAMDNMLMGTAEKR